MILVGSRAVVDYINRPLGVDYDYLVKSRDDVPNIGDLILEKKHSCAFKDQDTGHIYEYDYRPTTSDLIDMLEGYSLSSLDLVYTLKMSHRFLKDSPHFYKTMRDIHVLRGHGAKIPNHLKKWFKRREKETYYYRHPKLNQSKKDFFDGSVIYIFDHDSIHRAVKLYDRPAYTYFKDDQAEVWCSKTKFDKCDESIKLASVYEESCVLALERSLVPFEFKPKPQSAFFKALEKVCTSITSGWWRDYAWENYSRVAQMYLDKPTKYVEDFINGVRDGTIQKAN